MRLLKTHSAVSRTSLIGNLEDTAGRLFNVEKDPGEKHNRFVSNPARDAEKKAALVRVEVKRCPGEVANQNRSFRQARMAKCELTMPGL